MSSMIIAPSFPIGMSLMMFGAYWMRHLRVVSHASLLVLGGLLLASPLFIPIGQTWQLSLSNDLNLPITLNFAFDYLTWVMMAAVSVITLVIHRFASDYLRFDANQARFIGQLYMLFFAVIMLIMSSSLLTAFIAWQLIGVSLYLLLNHYHYGIKANKAAKKKFMINRIGDICFLFACVIAQQSYGSTLFDNISGASQVVDGTILALVLVAVMTKTAQFPFHPWLPDTMETPTPVSAMMHAGVINAGGYLLARMSHLYVELPFLLLFMFAVGLITTLYAYQHMKNHYDVKRKLAYSTMGQMGFMLMQCGLGCFSSAVFHLITHGFCKSLQFLESGSRIQKPQPLLRVDSRVTKCHAMLLTTGLMLFGLILLYIFTHCVAQNPLLLGFTAITLYQFTYQIASALYNRVVKLIALTMLAGIYLMYLLAMTSFVNLLSDTSVETVSLSMAPLLLFSLLVCLLPSMPFVKSFAKRYVPVATNALQKGVTSFEIERAYRRGVINPIRYAGDWTIARCKRMLSSSASIVNSLLILLSCVMTLYALGIDPLAMVMEHRAFVLLSVIVLFCLSANRTFSLMSMVVQLSVVIILTACMPALALDTRDWTPSMYYLITTTPILLALLLLVLDNSDANPREASTAGNKLPIAHFYLATMLLLMIGIPGTSSFIFDITLVDLLLKQSVLLAALFAIGMAILSLTILHALQLHFFHPDARVRHSKPITSQTHLICISAIALNLFAGVFPGVVMSYLT